MNRIKTGSIFVVLVVLVLFGMSAAFAKPPGEAHHGKGTHHGKKGTHYEQGYHHNHFFMMVKRLNLSQDQKRELAGILKEHQAQAKEYKKAMLEAKKGLVSVMMSDPGNTNAVNAAFDKVVEAKRNLVTFKAQVMNEFMGILTPEQKNALEKMKTDIFSKMDSRFDAHFAHMDEWINKYSSQ